MVPCTRKKDRGAVALIVGIAMLILLGFAALAVDIGYVMVTRNELQNTADAAALAATRQLGVLYEGLTYQDQLAYVCDPAAIIPVAQETAQSNRAGGRNIAVNSADVTIGQWDAQTKTLTPTLNHPNAVEVIVRRDGQGNGPITTFFARAFGRSTVDLTSRATAALTSLSITGPGELGTPVGISKAWFRTGFCDQPIKFYPTGTLEGCAGWHTYDSSTHSNNQLRQILQGLNADTYQSPEAWAGATEFNFTGGTLGQQAFSDFETLFHTRRVLNDGRLDNDTDPNTWTTAVVVYDVDDCSNPQNELLIVGFATVTITQVIGPPTMTIEAKVICENIEPGRGGGTNYGTMGTIPGLVQ